MLQFGVYLVFEILLLSTESELLWVIGEFEVFGEQLLFIVTLTRQHLIQLGSRFYKQRLIVISYNILCWLAPRKKSTTAIICKYYLSIKQHSIQLLSICYLQLLIVVSNNICTGLHQISLWVVLIVIYLSIFLIRRKSNSNINSNNFCRTDQYKQ